MLGWQEPQGRATYTSSVFENKSKSGIGMVDNILLVITLFFFLLHQP
jgi:hypothetical protein